MQRRLALWDIALTVRQSYEASFIVVASAANDA